MAWKIKYSKEALKALKKIDKLQAKRILDTLEYKIAELDNPRIVGKSLQGNLKSLWRYRIGDYRILCDIQDDQFIILAVFVGHRKNVYKF